jgi:hypothetical protein
VLRAVPPGGLPPEETIQEFVSKLDFSDCEWVAIMKSVDGELMLDIAGVDAEKLYFALAKTQAWVLDEF